jgi:hypothetical protein
MQYVLSRPSTLPKLTKRQILTKLQREVKRRMIADGVIEDPSQREPRFEWHWEYVDSVLGNLVHHGGGVVKADTRSEARALIKEELGRTVPTTFSNLKRLPHNISIVKVVPNATARPFTLPNAGVAA